MGIEHNIHTVYDKIGKEYSEKVYGSPYNAYYERPTMLDLIGKVKDLNILDVGCGNGVYSEFFLKQGAKKVVAFDNSLTMVEIAKKKLGDNVEIYHADISEPLDFAKENYFDLIVCPLVLHYVKDWDFIFKELNRKLKKGGRLIFSISHPFADMDSSKSKNYHSVELIEEYWPSFDMHVKTYRRSLSSIFSEFISNGFSLIKLKEPLPINQLEKIDKSKFDYLSTQPVFICFELIKERDEFTAC